VTGDRCVIGCDTGVRITNGVPEEAILPGPVAHFVDLFDAHKYPDLEA
jgi:hypothetical protein